MSLRKKFFDVGEGFIEGVTAGELVLFNKSLEASGMHYNPRLNLEIEQRCEKIRENNYLFSGGFAGVTASVVGFVSSGIVALYHLKELAN